MKRSGALGGLVFLLFFVLGVPARTQKPAPCHGEHYVQFDKEAIKVPLPDVQQPDNYTCGVACLMSILAYYGDGPEDYDALRKKLGVTKNGADFHRILEYAKKCGLRTAAHEKMDLKQLLKCLDDHQPVICSIQAYDDEHKPNERHQLYKEENVNGHYVVAIGYDTANVYFMDPSLTGRRGFLPKREFEDRWHDDEGTKAKPHVIRHLGVVIWKENSGGANHRCARHID